MSIYSIFQIFPGALKKKLCQPKVKPFIIAKFYDSSHYVHADSKLLFLTSQKCYEMTLLYMSKIIF